eukprot:TRINITY_DN2062_c0_g1_i1.p1 TRINITY_DN2062_c0_g1~~TRINITY_DN2062_c0_g1_i1.p1  ORF type:complete len:290 (-),score=12.10 TRINITY_DN2062_c0_g1_i1:32-844(-)
MNSQDYDNLPFVAPSVELNYGVEDQQQFGHLYLPTNTTPGPHPVVLLVHGGCWLSSYDLRPVSGFAKALADQGIAVWSIEYRRIGSGGGWPNTFLDAARGADYIRQIAGNYSLDITNGITVVGHSAGGHLASWLASRQKLSPDSELFTANPILISKVISLAGIPDLETALNEGVCGYLVAQLMGGEPGEFPKRYEEGSPKRLAPIHTSQFFVSGFEDSIVPFAYVSTYVKFARDVGDPVGFRAFNDTGHFELVTPSTTAGSWIVTEIAQG